MLSVSEETLLAALRYALTRRSYITDTVAKDLLNNIFDLSQKSVKIIISEIKENFPQIKDDIDKEIWLDVLKKFEEKCNELD